MSKLFGWFSKNKKAEKQKAQAEEEARAKAEAVSAQSGDAFVIGGDQVMAMGDKIYGKPQSMEDARVRLLDLGGKSHQLHTAVVVATGGVTVWAHTDVATLTMRLAARRCSPTGSPILTSRSIVILPSARPDR